MSEENEETKEDGKSAVFNMALDTLQRLGRILDEIKNLQYKTEHTIHILQSIKVGLVKQFFIQASPLLPEKSVKKYQKDILNLIPKVVELVRNRSGGGRERLGLVFRFDRDLEIRLDQILIELQLILQKEKYFMPSEDEGDF